MKNLLFTCFSTPRLGKILGVTLGLGALFNQSLQAVDTVYVSSYTGSSVTADPPYKFVSGTSYSSFGSTAFASPPGAPTRTKTVYGYSADCVWRLTPTLGVPGAVYQIETAHTAATTSADVLMTLSSTDGDLSASCTNTTAFNSAHGGNTWQTIGYITNHVGVTAPVILFSISGGTLGPASTANRCYFDVFKFTEVNPCSGVAADVTVAGPLSANQTFVNVLGVTAGATNISVYADNSFIGELTAGIVAGSNQVPTSALSPASEIKATQTKNGCISSLAGTGKIVGSGNVQISAFLSCYSNSAFAGPVGANTASPGVNNYTLKATGLSQGSQSAPTGGTALAPSSCWQTISFSQTDAALYPGSGLNASGNNNPYCALEGLVFSINAFAPDTGPYDIYIDRIMNGDVVIEDFESYAVNTTNTFAAPSAATNPGSAGYMTGPNSSLISTNNAFDGTKSCRIRFQFADATAIRWAHIIAGAATGKRYPQIDTTKPITVRYLLLAPGDTTNKLHFPTIPPSRQTLLTGSSVTWTVAPTGLGGYTYQWKLNDSDIADQTLNSFTKSSLQLADSGKYSVVVTGENGSGCPATLDQFLTVVDTVPVLTPSVVTTNITLSWSGPFMLQSTTNLSGTWTDVSTNTGFQQPINKTGPKFYRLRP